MIGRYTPPHLFRDDDTRLSGHITQHHPEYKIDVSWNPRQWVELRDTVDHRLAEWQAASNEERAHLASVLTWCSDGGGTQSTTIKRLCEHGEHRRPDVYIFADTQYESHAVYDALRALHAHGNIDTPIIACTAGDLYHDQAVLRAHRGRSGASARFAALPFFTRAPHEAVEGRIKRQCTSEYKIEVVHKVVRMLLGLAPRHRYPKLGRPYCQQWLGISTDEIRRAKTSLKHWYTIEHPLIDLRMSRDDCRAWMERHGFAQPPRSACIGCPLRSNDEWLELPSEEMKSAVAFDAAIRHAAGEERPSYVHRSCKPLSEVDFHDGAEDQMSLFSGCDSGYCGT